MEQPEDLAREVREFFRPLRGSRPTGPAAGESGGGDQ
jgi:hypothetical protein